MGPSQALCCHAEQLFSLRGCAGMQGKYTLCLFWPDSRLCPGRQRESVLHHSIWARILHTHAGQAGLAPRLCRASVRLCAVQGGYNLCHFWSNFELGDLRFFRSRPYLDFFDYLDR